MPTNKKQTGLRMSNLMYAKIKYLSETDGRTINNFVEHVLQCYIEKYEIEHGAIPIADDNKD